VADSDSPITYGYGDDLGVYFNTTPIFQVASGGRGGSGFGEPEDLGGPGSTTTRRTGRGGVDEADVVQGRRGDLGEAGVEAFRADQAEEDSTGSASSAANRVRTVMRYSRDVEDLLISGGLRNGESLAGTPALLDVTLGEGHVILFSFNPFWRSETLGSYGLVFNTIMHYRNLATGTERPITD